MCWSADPWRPRATVTTSVDAVTSAGCSSGRPAGRRPVPTPSDRLGGPDPGESGDQWPPPLLEPAPRLRAGRANDQGLNAHLAERLRLAQNGVRIRVVGCLQEPGHLDFGEVTPDVGAMPAQDIQLVGDE